MTTQPESLSDTGQTFTVNGTSSSAADTTLSQSMLSVEDFPVRIYPTPDEEQDLMEIEAGSSLKPLAWFANYDRERLCWRTWQGCLLEGWTEFLGRWPRSGLMLNGIAYRLPPLVRRISGTGYLSSGHSIPTPTASDCARMPNTGRNSKGPTLHEIAEQGIPLMWPTPKSSAAGPDFAKMNGRDNRKPGPGLSLATMAAMYPTPTARDWKDNGKSPAELSRHSETLAMKAGGQLNPTWVEWLMGFPLGWTALDASATQ
jgi:hypothetical protein